MAVCELSVIFDLSFSPLSMRERGAEGAARWVKVIVAREIRGGQKPAQPEPPRPDPPKTAGF
jgi:hypothetical protein